MNVREVKGKKKMIVSFVLVVTTDQACLSFQKQWPVGEYTSGLRNL